jgi:hypothetical protein
MDAWHDFYLNPNCSKQRKFAHSKENLLTKIKFAQSKNLLKKIAHGRNLLTEFARSIEKLLTIKNLAGSDGSTRRLNVSHQANRSTAGAHHSTVSVVMAGMCWAGPSSCTALSWDASLCIMENDEIWGAILTILCRDSSTVDSRQWSRDDRKTENAFLLKTKILCWEDHTFSIWLTNVINRIFVFYYKDARNNNDRQIWMSELFLFIEFPY